MAQAVSRPLGPSDHVCVTGATGFIGSAIVRALVNRGCAVRAVVEPAIEQTNISVGRGTDTPFEQLGAPWIDGPALAAALNASALPGVRFYPVTFTPAAGAKLAGQTCHGVSMIVTDRAALHPVRVGVEIASALSRMYGQQFRLEDAATLLGSRATIQKIRAGEDPLAITQSWTADEAKWRAIRAKYLLYPLG